MKTDEAHKGKGNYAYAQIIRELMHKNPHFRVLALTATPGSKSEDVQELCDALHISRIEIRDEFSPDLKQYIFDKVCSFVITSRPSRQLYPFPVCRKSNSILWK
jgi:ERCC4-related helicase